LNVKELTCIFKATYCQKISEDEHRDRFAVIRPHGHVSMQFCSQQTENSLRFVYITPSRKAGQQTPL